MALDIGSISEELDELIKYITGRKGWQRSMSDFGEVLEYLHPITTDDSWTFAECCNQYFLVGTTEVGTTILLELEAGSGELREVWLLTGGQPVKFKESFCVCDWEPEDEDEDEYDDEDEDEE